MAEPEPEPEPASSVADIGESETAEPALDENEDDQPATPGALRRRAAERERIAASRRVGARGSMRSRITEALGGKAEEER